MGRKDPHTIYVLKLEPGEDPNAKWYVGITVDYEQRLYQHKAGHGVDWTERNTIVDDFALGRAEDRNSAEEFEKNLTKVLAREYGWDATRGAFGGRKKENLPDVDDSLLHPSIAETLESVDDDELAAITKYTGVTLKLRTEMLFTDPADACQWADRYLPDGTGFKIQYPDRIARVSHAANSSNLKVGNEPQLVKKAHHRGE